jgi:hypothetical protein
MTTQTLICDLLGDADQTRPNPLYLSAAPVRLWSLQRVTEAEASPAIADRKARGRRRSAASAAAADRKRDELLSRISDVPVNVPRLERAQLVRLACEHYNGAEPL